MQTTATVNTPAQPRSALGTLVWIWQVITGVALIPLTGLHMVAQHFMVEGGLRGFDQVQSFLSNPLVWPIELLLLISVVSHALLGVRAVLVDLGPSPRLARLIDPILWVVGIASVTYGAWLTYTLVSAA
jgi:succinate dehydrogenase hydrophobic anchor subunit